MGTRQSEITANFPACWTALEIANQRVKSRSCRESEGENSRRGGESFQCCRNPCGELKNDGADDLRMPAGLGSALRVPEGLGWVVLGSQLRWEGLIADQVEGFAALQLGWGGMSQPGYCGRTALFGS